MPGNPLRFSVQGYSATSAADFRDQVRTAESFGYSAFHLADHYLGPGPALTAANHPPQDIAVIPAMAMAAEATSHIKIGCRSPQRKMMTADTTTAIIPQHSTGKSEESRWSN
jgi:Luciferase-like monooxygenase